MGGNTSTEVLIGVEMCRRGEGRNHFERDEISVRPEFLMKDESIRFRFAIEEVENFLFGSFDRIPFGRETMGQTNGEGRGGHVHDGRGDDLVHQPMIVFQRDVLPFRTSES